MLSMEDSMRTKWTNLPLGLAPRAGLRYGDLSEESMINLTATGSEYALTPLFFGSDPAVVEETQYAGLRPLSKEEDYGFWFVNLLDEAQKAKAVFEDKVPGDIITSPDRPQWITEFRGIKGSELNPD